MTNSPQSRDLTRPGIAAGIVGAALLVLVEVFPRPATIPPSIRFAPPIRLDYVALSAEPTVAFAFAPTVESLRDAFSRTGYTLDRVRGGQSSVPRLRLTGVPRGLPDIRDPSERKTFFLTLALPLILEANQRILGKRERLQQITFRLMEGQPISVEMRDWLGRLADEYGAEPDRIDVLLSRVDAVPVSLALAQAANESGWGTSRFSLEGNAFFGQWTTAGGRGMVPRERPEGMTYKVRAFDRLIDSVHAYMLNLNTHRSYRKFRAMRQDLREAGEPLDGMMLAGALKSYSELGDEYVAMLRGIIRVNDLEAFDSARLGGTVVGFLKGA